MPRVSANILTAYRQDSELLVTKSEKLCTIQLISVLFINDHLFVSIQFSKESMKGRGQRGKQCFPNSSAQHARLKKKCTELFFSPRE